MTPSESLRRLYRIAECPDIMADACISDDSGHLVFLSVWARDTAIQQFIARLTLGSKDDGLDQFHILTETGHSVPVFVGNVDGLDKRLTRSYRRTLFGSLVHLWLYDRRCIAPDKANSRALALLPKDCQETTARLWRLVQDTCPLPLLDHWQDTVMSLLRQSEMLARLPRLLGPMEAHRLCIDVPRISEHIGALIRSGRLTAEPAHGTQQELLALAS